MEDHLLIPPSPALVVAAANAFVGLGEEFGAPLSGPQGALVERLLHEVRGQRDDDTRHAWDAAFVHHVGYWALYSEELGVSSWPLPAVASPTELAQYASITGSVRTSPLAGDVFLHRNPAQRAFVRAGIVASVYWRGRFETGEEYFECVTIEGNSDLQQSRTGTQVLRLQRQLVPGWGDQFIRWTAIHDREQRQAAIEETLDAAALKVAA